MMNETEKYDVVIIGAGTAGLTAGIYAARASKNVLVLEENAYGGQIIYSSEIENYPGIMNISGVQFAKDLYEQALNSKVEVRFEKVNEIKVVQNDEYNKVVCTENNDYKTKNIIIATGSRNRKLGLDREKELTGAGVSYCAICDGPFYRERKVAVVGGGNTAVEEAIYLADICKKVYIIQRRNEFRAEERLVKSLEQKLNVEYRMNTMVVAINGDNRLKSIELSNGENIELDALFVAIGREPQNEKFKDIIQLDENGYIIAGEDCKTAVDGIFAAGDCRTKKIRQLVTATADGAIAALLLKQ